MTCFAEACKEFGLTISLKESSSKVMDQDFDTNTSTNIFDNNPEVIHEFIYLGSTISDNLSFEK